MHVTCNSGALPAKKYYRQQTIEHVSHDESGAFTQAAINNFANFNNINANTVTTSSYKSKQGVPAGPGWFQI
jgi:hypothetical protein